MNYTIGITTYEKRFGKYLKPLILSIKEHRPDIEIILTINGENKKHFDKDYLSSILSFCSTQTSVYPSVFPNFRSLCKLWNTCLVNSSNENILILNDDITISSEVFFIHLEGFLPRSRPRQSFKINGSWSHSFLNRQEVNEVGWFDERYLGIGEEDGDFEWRWERRFGSPVSTINLPGIINHVDHDNCLLNINVVNNKYSQFNYDFAFNEKYKGCPDGDNFGIMNRSLKCESETPGLYGAEKFYWENIHKL